ncbi:MAG TPA: hypothetical protein VGO79_07400 [Thermoanaerobaculia bacterium]
MKHWKETAEVLARVFAPVGLDLGAEGSEQVAIRDSRSAIVGEPPAVHGSRALVAS